MTRPPQLALLIVSALSAPAMAQAPKVSPAPKYADYPAAAIYRGPSAAPDYSGAGKGWFDYRTRIRNGLQAGVNFAGQIAIVEIGCGTGCRFIATADLKTGRLGGFPLGGEDTPYLNLRYRPDSALVIAHWENGDRCIRQSFVWSGAHFRQVEMADIGEREACAAAG